MHEQAKFICFIYMQLQKVKFKFVQKNMKHLLYTSAPIQCNSKSNHGASQTNSWVEGFLVLYAWSYVLASMFGVRRPGMLH